MGALRMSDAESLHHRSESSEKSWRRNERLAQLNGSRRTVYEVNGDAYVGEWKNNRRHGQGKVVWRDGKVYDGQWQEGMRHGRGILLTSVKGQPQRVEYTGMWSNDMMHGYGTYFYANGERYEGEWKEGVRGGQGRHYWMNGDIYAGGWERDSQHGSGTMQYADGRRYEGQWKSGKKHGEGVFFYASRKYVGVWVDDVPRCGEYIAFGGKEDSRIPPNTLVDAESVFKKAKGEYLGHCEEPADELEQS